MNNIYILSFICLLFAISCKNNTNKKNITTGDVEHPQYAKLFNIEKHDRYKYINVLDQNGENIYRLIVANENGCVPKDNNADFVISKKITNIGILSSTNIGYLKAIGKADLIRSSTNPKRIYDSTLFSGFQNGDIANIGDEMKTNVEKILDLKPDIVFHTGFEQNSKIENLLHKAGIAYVPIIEWKEENIFGRTEWVKLFGEIFNQRHKADSTFNEKVKRYNILKKKTKELKNKPSILYGNNFKGTWHMPGGKSYVAQILRDAGSNYHFINDTTRGTLHLSIEYVIDILKDADYWLAPSANSINELKSKDKHYSIFKALKQNKVYNYTARVNKNGYNDYWESGVMNPDIILSDIIYILHPYLLDNYKPFYYKQLH